MYSFLFKVEMWENLQSPRRPLTPVGEGKTTFAIVKGRRGRKKKPQPLVIVGTEAETSDGLEQGTKQMEIEKQDQTTITTTNTTTATTIETIETTITTLVMSNRKRKRISVEEGNEASAIQASFCKRMRCKLIETERRSEEDTESNQQFEDMVRLEADLEKLENNIISLCHEVPRILIFAKRIESEEVEEEEEKIIIDKQAALLENQEYIRRQFGMIQAETRSSLFDLGPAVRDVSAAAQEKADSQMSIMQQNLSSAASEEEEEEKTSESPLGSLIGFIGSAVSLIASAVFPRKEEMADSHADEANLAEVENRLQESLARRDSLREKLVKKFSGRGQLLLQGILGPALRLIEDREQKKTEKGFSNNDNKDKDSISEKEELVDAQQAYKRIIEALISNVDKVVSEQDKELQSMALRERQIW